jgi:phosphoribosyl 1,2-cyclic phosphodiesterase
MEIVFLGTGGGRFNLVRQIRKTGGWRINGPLNIHVDPGPGALFSSLHYVQDASKLDLIIITHNHIDHANDAGLLVEAFSSYGKKRGFLVGSKSAVDGDAKGDRGISRYHRDSLEKHWVAVPGKRLALRIRGVKLSLMPTKVRHEDRTGFGFVLEMGGKKIGYTSDTEYFRGIGKLYAGCDVLIANCLKPKQDGIPGHLDSQGARRLFAEATPKLAVLAHLGMSMLRAGPEKEAARIQRETGVRTVAAKDGMRLGIGRLRAQTPHRKA